MRAIRPRLVVASLAVVSALLFVAMAIHSAPLDPSIPVLQLSFSEAAFRAVLEAWQGAGVARFKAHFAFDFPLLLSYGALGFALATRTRLLHACAPKRRVLLALALPCAALADAGENLIHLHLAFGAGPFLPAHYVLACSLASAKWTLIALFVACAVVSLCRAAYGRASAARD